MSPRTTRTSRVRPIAVALTALSLVALAACEGDDDSMSAEACDAYADFQSAMFGDPAAMAAAAQAFADAAPDASSDDAATIVTAVSKMGDDPSALDNPEVSAALQSVGDSVYDDCDADKKLDVAGIDYAFEDIPAQIEAGRVAIRFTNDSAAGEPHELVLATGADGQSAADLAALPIDQLFQQARPLAVAFTTGPDTHATTLVDLPAGEYLVICTLPVGGFAEGQDGPPADPHSHHGMVTTLKVV
jgi:hypothetical protein